MPEHIVLPEKPLVLSISSETLYSEDRLIVQPNEVYRFSVPASDRWKDWFIPASADGFFNPLALLSGIRVKGVKCFCLCGCIDENDTTAFPIGLGTERMMTSHGKLSFFANDAKNYYHNNRGSIQLTITKV